MTNNAALALGCALCFCLLGCVTWFLSSRPRAFIRCFVPRDELRNAVRGILRNSTFGSAMRIMAALQVAAGTVIGLLAIASWMAS
jgi:hypothetical protein